MTIRELATSHVLLAATALLLVTTSACNNDSANDYADGDSTTATAVAPVIELPEFTDEQIDQYKDLEKQASKALQNDEPAKSVELFQQVFAIHDGNSGMYYNFACASARNEQPDEAMAALQTAAELGWTDAAWPPQDSDLEAVHERDDFKQWIATVSAYEASWPVVDTTDLADDEATIDARYDAQKKQIRRIRSLLGNSAYRGKLYELDSWRAASWDAIAAGRPEGESRLEAQLNGLASVSGDAVPRRLAATEVLRRIEALRPTLGTSSRAADVDLYAARAKFAIDRSGDGDHDEAEAQFLSELTTITTSYTDGPAVEAALLTLIGEGTENSEAMSKNYARLKTLLEFDELRTRMLQSARAAFYQLEGMPEFTATTLAGTPLTRASLEGQVTLVDFWATWCGPCKEELPNLKEVYERHHNEGFEIVGISLDDGEDIDREAFQAWVTKNEMPWPQIFDGNGWDAELGKQFGVKSIPFAILLDRDLNVVAAGDDVRGENLATQVEKLMTPKQAKLQ